MQKIKVKPRFKGSGNAAHRADYRTRLADRQTSLGSALSPARLEHAKRVFDDSTISKLAK